MIRVRVLFFASLRDAAGAAESTLELPDGARVSDAWSEAVRRWPALGARKASTAIAVNGSIARAEARLADGDEIALLPPVSGG